MGVWICGARYLRLHSRPNLDQFGPPQGAARTVTAEGSEEFLQRLLSTIDPTNTQSTLKQFKRLFSNCLECAR